ncbi:OmpA family protein [Lichenicoccus sp.]|uniref:OmpA family protein n=1 Tax=Lichenicoccus sp. TaxID=2781899 RepID=UPI003D11D9B5
MDGFSSGHPYIGVAGGPSILQDIAVDPGDGPLGPGPATERYNLGFIGAGAAGWAFSNGVQVDVLGAYEYNSLNNLVKVPVPGYQTGHQESYGGFLEALYAFKLPEFGIPITAFSPYLGVGTGALWTHQTSPEFLSNGDEHHIGGTSGANFAYEGIAGVAVPIAAVPGLALTADYRLVGVHNPGDLNSVFYNKVDNAIVKGGIGLQKDVFVHVITVGLAYAFGVAAPPPPEPATMPPAPAPMPARSYLVFFDWDSAALSARAAEVVAEAAQNSTRVQTTRIDVDGYADTSHAGSEKRGTAYNLRLSMKRAFMVQRELVRDGVPGGAIETHGFGDTKLLVATGPDSREPQNRRVEIVLH